MYMSKKQNIRPLVSGEHFDKLTVIELFGKDKNGKVAYLCQCQCGKQRVVRRSYLLSGRTKSCGCGKRLASSLTGKKYIHLANEACRQFVGDLSGALWKRIEFNASIRKLKLEITKEYAWELFLKQNKKCALTGLDLYMNPHHINRNKVTASLDRIDSSQGYVLGNVQWIHKDVNRMKNDFPEIRFREICRLVTKYDTESTTQFR